MKFWITNSGVQGFAPRFYRRPGRFVLRGLGVVFSVKWG